jgi:hypothetical protein
MCLKSTQVSLLGRPNQTHFACVSESSCILAVPDLAHYLYISVCVGISLYFGVCGRILSIFSVCVCEQILSIFSVCVCVCVSIFSLYFGVCGRILSIFSVCVCV